MRAVRYIPLLIAALVACKSSKKPDEPPPQAAPAAKIPTIKCSQAVPDAIKAKYFPDAKMTTSDDPIDGGDGPVTSCHYRDDKRLTKIDIRCGPSFTNLDSYLSSVQGQVDVKYERVSGVGRGAFAKNTPGKPEFALVHSTLPCQIDVELYADDPANAFDPKPVALAIADALGK
jgi:hypothetical protein